MKIVCTLCFTLISSIALAQHHQVRGIIADKATEEPLIGANIILMLDSDTTKRSFSVTDIDGNFTFKRVQPGSYRISVSYIGYNNFTRQVEVARHDNDLGVITIEQKSELLHEVTIKGKVPAAIQKGDTLQFNADAYTTNPDANAENLLEKMPGIMVEDGKVQAQGEDVRRVLVDGREFFGNDPNAVLKNIPADIIQQIQIFDQQNEQSQFTGFDDGNTIKTINIVTRPEARNGFFGNAHAGYGTDDRYSAGAVVNDFNEDRRISILGLSNNINEQNFSSEDLAGVMSSPSGGGRRGGGRGGRRGGGNERRGGGMGNGNNVNDFLVAQQNGNTTTNSFGINYSDDWGEKLDLTGSYFFNKTANAVNMNVYRQYILPSDSGTVYNEQEQALGTNVNHRANLRLNYQINERNSLLYRPSFTVQFNDGNSQIFGETSNGDQIINSLNNTFNSDLSAFRISNSLLFRHRFNKIGRTLSVNFSHQYNTTQGDSYLNVDTYLDEEVRDSLDQVADMDKYRHAFTGNIVLTERLGENLMLTLNQRSTWALNDAEHSTYQWDKSTDAYGPRDSLLSNMFSSAFITHETGAGLVYRKDHLTLTGRLSYQHAELISDQQFPEIFNITRPFKNILPMFSLRHREKGGKSFTLTYRTSTDEPSADQLQEVLDNDNPLQLHIGNANLVQQYEHRVFMRYSAPNVEKSTVFFAYLSGTLTNNYVGRQIYFARRERVVENNIVIPAGAQLTKPVNLNGHYNLRGFITYGMPVNFISSNLNVNLSGSYSQTPGMVNDRLNYSYSPSVGGGITLSSNISEKIDFTLSGHSDYNHVTNSMKNRKDRAYLSNRLRGRVYWDIWKGIVFTSNLSYRWYNGLSDGYNQRFMLWNLSIGKRLFDERGEIRLSAYDILKKNTNIDRRIRINYVEDVQTEILQRYFMLSFKYKIRSFG